MTTGGLEAGKGYVEGWSGDHSVLVDLGRRRGRRGGGAQQR
ncbi:hypothetical protein [Streptomyces mangrovisoli]|nr:hypothetical protein [Streptomyces mangrovisoli]